MLALDQGDERGERIPPDEPRRRVLVLGGARSGKSAFAERRAADRGGPVVYVATATESDAEMQERIARHRARRPADWITVEAPLDVAAALAAEATRRRVQSVVVEDLTLLLSNLMVGPNHARAEVSPAQAEAAERTAMAEIDALLALPVDLILVSNEVGMGLVPPYPIGRLFRDALGRLNQYVAGQVDEAYLLVAGLPLRLK